MNRPHHERRGRHQPRLRRTILGEHLEPRHLLAAADAYLAATGESLAVLAAEGVLANDQLDPGMAAMAELVTEPQQGQLAFAPDGSFHYTANRGFTGFDGFEYRIVTAEGTSNPIGVTLQVVPQVLLLNEVVTSNSTGLATRLRLTPDAVFAGDPQSPDWFEIRNLADRPLDLSGYFVSDSRNQPAKWQLPAGTTIPASGYLVLFASGNNVADARLDEQGYLHTNFRLSSDGEYLGIFDPQGGLVHAIEPQLPVVRGDIAYGIAQTGFQFLTTPTPGRSNQASAAFPFALGEVTGSVDHGFFQAPFELNLQAPADADRLRYTLDGSEPTTTNGLDYEGKLSISQTTVLRAAAFRDGYLPSPVATWSYIFLDDVLRQSPDGAPPEGWPQRAKTQRMDYGMDPDIVDSQEWGPSMNDALTQLPSLSIVIDRFHLFDSRTGIYANAFEDGVAWERPASVELIQPNGSTGFQINAGLRIRGGFSRSSSNPKHSLRLFFRGSYGDSRLDFPLFAEEGADSFEQIDLRTAQNNGWNFGQNKNSFIRDEFSRDTQRDLGQPYKRGRYYHLYLNGLYWGIYQTDERAESDYAATYFGGNKQDYDVVKTNNGFTYATSGSLDEWNRLWEIAGRGFADNAAYFAVQGKNPDGTDNPQLERHVDVDNLIDYMLVIFYTGNTDGPTTTAGINNFYAIRNRATRDGWKFFAHDAEHTLLSLTIDNTRDSAVGQQQNQFNPRWLHQQLMTNAEYRMRFADRMHQLFFGDGALTPKQVAARIQARVDELDQAIIAESARWGDLTRIQYTKQDWLADVQFVLGSLVPERTGIVVQQLLGRGAYPSLQPPVIEPGGDVASEPLEVRIGAPAGVVYYTLDGSDPRDLGGGIRSSALTIDPGTALNVARDLVVQARAWDGQAWSPLVSASFTVGAGEPPWPLRVSEVHYHPGVPTAVEIAKGFNDADEFDFIELTNPADYTIRLEDVRLVQAPRDGVPEGVVFDFAAAGITRLAAGERIVVVENLAAFRARYGSAPRVAGEWTGALSNRSEQITLMFGEQLLQSFIYHDAWHPTTDGIGASLEMVEPLTSDVSRWNEPNAWRPSIPAGGTPGRAPLIPGDTDGNGIFDSADLVLLFQLGEYEDALSQNSSFSSGDWNGDGDFTTSDFVFAFQYGLFSPDAILFLPPE